jgi:Helix-turn-helix domain
MTPSFSAVLLTPEQAAAALGRSPRTIERYRHKGIGPHYERPLGDAQGRVRYRLDHLIAWIQNH